MSEKNCKNCRKHPCSGITIGLPDGSCNSYDQKPEAEVEEKEYFKCPFCKKTSSFAKGIINNGNAIACICGYFYKPEPK